MNDEQMAKSAEAMKSCAAEFKMSPEDIAKLKANDGSNGTQQNKVIFWMKAVLWHWLTTVAQ